MTLRRKMSFQILAMILGLLVISIAAVRGLRGLKQDYGTALRGYQQLRLVFDAGSHLNGARLLLQSGSDGADVAATELAAAAAAIAQLGDTPESGSLTSRAADLQALRQNLTEATNALSGRSLPADGDVAVSPALARARASEAITAAIGRLPALTADIRHDIEANQEASEVRLQVTTWSLLVVCGAVIIGALLLGAWQYRGVVQPLNRLTAGVRRIAAGRFEQRVDARGDDEFSRLANDFNRMAEELDGFYRQLEAKVAQKSKELIQSERLASVGYLAAGVAHEINNPLGIITGYAELLLQRLPEVNRGGGTTKSGSADIDRTLRIICDEAYRCKGITDKLLSLARQADDEARRPVDLAKIASSVASLMGGLRQFADRTLTVRADAGADLAVNAVEAQMNQVVTNLVLNALEATPRREGAVTIEISRRNDRVEMTLIDNGRGMTPQTAERVFEPFFTQKHAGQSAETEGERKIGTGLGLSITHAIVEGHGGRIRAHSDGLGKGSRFTVDLPAAQTNGTALAYPAATPAAEEVG